MTINEHLIQFCGKPVVDFDTNKKIMDPQGEAIRISLNYSEYEDDGLYWEDKLDRLLADPLVEHLESLVIGPWEDVGSQDTEFIVELLVKYKDKLCGLRQMFFGDVIMEESECSWLDHGDISELWSAFPKLTHFAIRGAGGLTIGDGLGQCKDLRSFVLQCSGLPADVPSDLATKLPELEHLEIWLGEENYGAEYTIDSIDRLINGDYFPKLRYLGLKNAEKADEIAELIARSKVVSKLRVLDLSMGTLSDAGGEALLKCPHLKNLDYLDLHYHFMSDDMIKKFLSLGIKVNLDDKQEGDREEDGTIWRFIAVSE
ncbi:STM4015 family protein [Candidatus Obscuribacterales bacterium]|nr:STM4015 family protein [Candidatus Obscuribacterales bacterium]MBX3148832.1 STM4015 family protein [Candidatus Obscuribacterales bacterium]